MKHEVIIEYDADHGLTIPVSLSMSVANNVIGELIRCKDCKWWNADTCMGWYDTLYTPSDGFCYKGERKEE